MSAIIRFGIAGFSYPDWAGVVYPKPKPKGFEPLSLIAQMVDTVEINSSFYAPVTARSANKWTKLVEEFPDFRLTVKLWQEFTHKPEFREDDITTFKKGLERIQASGKLACLLIQFPQSFRASDMSFDKVKKIAGYFREFNLVVEVRHRSWQKQWFLDWLKQAGIGFANIDQPIFDESIEPNEIITSQIGYVRLHGRNRENWFKQDAKVWERYDYLYKREELLPWLERVKRMAEHCQELYVINNNHFQAKGLANALEMKFLFTGKIQRAPERMIQRYSHLKEFCEPMDKQSSLF
jgi:uncharacterized protein YecE (DUF72 family)